MQDLYMLVHTGAVQAKEDWIQDIKDHDLKYTETKLSAEQIFKKYVDNRDIVEVRRTETHEERENHGDWIEAE